MNVDIKNFPKVTVILRGYDYNQTRNIVEILSNSRIKSVEIALKDSNVKDILKKIVDEFGDKILIGAGTILTKEDLIDVVKIGAKFVLSPIMFSEEQLQICKKNMVISVPGAFTPSEIYKSFQDGAGIVKVFPANTVTPKYFKDIKAPLGELKLMAVGGVNAKNALDYLANGADFLGIGSGIFSREDVIKGNYENVKKSIESFEAVLYK
ncbi:bifunctional 4-hydroxy-2-oxoglutarate aldolase/2-dehydro-3-deoxy-phosphogluconate aldolase [Clostridium sp.]|uniref:bifunctional 4-hydroxy-2-oxoglutarate aldolase/2-dehydro-3-deoxy-phosphogluconate aldolase n=1 Tax=Clostridium sp. TaxID=1506 RepID=UPI0026264831|nr:bifunctional 4-hydroxy-2-oxoglutarate aldolase/2-dehydro-3-deoxy-phosphogluconate aldolase [uncultured Clostridium sp.]